MNLTKLEFKKIFTPLTVIAVVVMLLLNLYMTFDYRAAYLLTALDPDSKSKPIETLKSEYAEKRGEITDEWIAARRSDVENILNDPKYLKTEDELKQYLSDLAAQGYPAEEIERLKSQPYTILNNNGITAYEHTEKFTYAASFYDNITVFHCKASKEKCQKGIDILCSSAIMRAQPNRISSGQGAFPDRR